MLCALRGCRMDKRLLTRLSRAIKFLPTDAPYRASLYCRRRRRGERAARLRLYEHRRRRRQRRRDSIYSFWGLYWNSCARLCIIRSRSCYNIFSRLKRIRFFFPEFFRMDIYKFEFLLHALLIGWTIIEFHR